ncbi:alpha/beta hydrolase [Legionella worsleiensis]|uniref:Carboxylesterase/phospholipase n=1 Tax=Legionella worsleiensis TaxID=45076 RepID=A0A0W1AJZ0_9GAMM|nr:carboxylesterase [Legionella worsleiensis]KTD81618.1 carboxylesterase/phospholipase [Legionella worsleiensis]STY31973.1 carboxylesterase/phospholipase [Legionella worsleiensis]
MSVYINDPQNKAQACVIWMHGLGADASDMMGLAKELMVTDVALRHVFIDAPSRPVTLNGGMVMPAWYDITGTRLLDREDKDGIEQSEQLIRHVIESQHQEGFDYSQIYLAGFSQGGAMALHTSLHSEHALGGVIALSAYLPLAGENHPRLDKGTAFFIGYGQFDPLVLPAWSEQSRDWLLNRGYADVSCHQYPMEHSICYEEIKDLSLWLTKQVQGAVSCP